MSQNQINDVGPQQQNQADQVNPLFSMEMNPNSAPFQILDLDPETPDFVMVNVERWVLLPINSYGNKAEDYIPGQALPDDCWYIFDMFDNQVFENDLKHTFLSENFYHKSLAGVKIIFTQENSSLYRPFMALFSQDLQRTILVTKGFLGKRLNDDGDYFNAFRNYRQRPPKWVFLSESNKVLTQDMLSLLKKRAMFSNQNDFCRVEDDLKNTQNYLLIDNKGNNLSGILYSTTDETIIPVDKGFIFDLREQIKLTNDAKEKTHKATFQEQNNQKILVILVFGFPGVGKSYVRNAVSTSITQDFQNELELKIISNDQTILDLYNQQTKQEETKEREPSDSMSDFIKKNQKGFMNTNLTALTSFCKEQSKTNPQKIIFWDKNLNPNAIASEVEMIKQAVGDNYQNRMKFCLMIPHEIENEGFSFQNGGKEGVLPFSCSFILQAIKKGIDRTSDVLKNGTKHTITDPRTLLKLQKQFILEYTEKKFDNNFLKDNGLDYFIKVPLSSEEYIPTEKGIKLMRNWLSDSLQTEKTLQTWIIGFIQSENGKNLEIYKQVSRQDILNAFFRSLSEIVSN